MVIAAIYRLMMPSELRKAIYDGFLGKVLLYKRNFNILFKGFLRTTFPFLYKKTSKNKAYRFLWENGISSYPGDYSLKYKNWKIEVLVEPDSTLPYVIHNGRNLFFPKNFSVDKVMTLYRSLIIEQDVDSPHRYVKHFSDLHGKVLVDVGAAEGIFSLDCIEYVKELILIESDKNWVSALEATFDPYKNKVSVLHKLVGDSKNPNEFTLDSIISRKIREDDKIFVKMDIEGFELKALDGASMVFQKFRNVSLAIATYHHKDHMRLIKEYFQSLNYRVSESEGYIYWNRQLNEVLLYANSSNQHK